MTLLLSSKPHQEFGVVAMKRFGVIFATLLLDITQSVNPVASPAHDWSSANALLRREQSEAKIYWEGPPTNVSRQHLLPSPRVSLIERRSERIQFSDVNVHNCQSRDDCYFRDCGDEATGATAMCSNRNCLKCEVSADCEGQADGFELAGEDVSGFCLQGKFTSLCPPSNCEDLPFPDDPDDPTGVRTCEGMLQLDTTFCTQPDMQDIVNVFCRGSCSVCNRTVTHITWGEDGATAHNHTVRPKAKAKTKHHDMKAKHEAAMEKKGRMIALGVACGGVVGLVLYLTFNRNAEKQREEAERKRQILAVDSGMFSKPPVQTEAAVEGEEHAEATAEGEAEEGEGEGEGAATDGVLPAQSPPAAPPPALGPQ